MSRTYSCISGFGMESQYANRSVKHVEDLLWLNNVQERFKSTKTSQHQSDSRWSAIETYPPSDEGKSPPAKKSAVL